MIYRRGTAASLTVQCVMMVPEGGGNGEQPGGTCAGNSQGTAREQPGTAGEQPRGTARGTARVNKKKKGTRAWDSTLGPTELSTQRSATILKWKSRNALRRKLEGGSCLRLHLACHHQGGRLVIYPGRGGPGLHVLDENEFILATELSNAPCSASQSSS